MLVTILLKTIFVPVLIPIPVKNIIWFRSRPGLSQRKTSVRVPEPKVFCRIRDREHFPPLYLNFFYVSSVLKKLCKTLSSFWNVSLKTSLKTWSKEYYWPWKYTQIWWSANRLIKFEHTFVHYNLFISMTNISDFYFLLFSTFWMRHLVYRSNNRGY